LRYEFDKSMAAGTVALIGWLALVSLVVIIFAAAFLSLAGIGPTTAHRHLHRGAWEYADAHHGCRHNGGDQGWSFRGVSLS